MHRDELSFLTIKDSINKILEYTADIDSYEQFVQDNRSIDACLMHLINIGEMVGRLSEETINDESIVEWRKIRGLRNIIAHDYFGVDYREIWSIISIHIPKLKKVVEGFLG